MRAATFASLFRIIMQISKKELENSQLEILVEFSPEEVTPYLERAALKISEELKIEGFRPGKAPLAVVQQKVGEMTIWEEASRLLINKRIDEILKEQLETKQIIGSPRVDITKLAPNNPLECRLTVSLLPEVTLGKYKDLGIKVDEAKVDEKELKKTFVELSEMKVKEFLAEADQIAQDGDKILLDIEISQDKVPVEGGTSQNVAIILGKDYLVPGFDKEIKGIKKGEERSFDILYPENHHQKNLAGKLASFKVKTKEIYRREVPKIDDEFAKSFNFKNLADMEEAIRKNIIAETEYKNNQKAELEMLEKIVEGIKVGNLPETLVNHETENMLEEFKHGLEHQGASLEDYLNHLKKNINEFTLELLPQAVKRVKIALSLRAISEAEKITASVEEIDKKITELKEHYKEDAEALKTITANSYRHYLENAIVHEKTLAKLKEWNLKK